MHEVSDDELIRELERREQSSLQDHSDQVAVDKSSILLASPSNPGGGEGWNGARSLPIQEYLDGSTEFGEYDADMHDDDVQTKADGTQTSTAPEFELMKDEQGVSSPSIQQLRETQGQASKNQAQSSLQTVTSTSFVQLRTLNEAQATTDNCAATVIQQNDLDYERNLIANKCAVIIQNAMRARIARMLVVSIRKDQYLRRKILEQQEMMQVM